MRLSPPRIPKNPPRGARCPRHGCLLDGGECPDCGREAATPPTDRHWNGRAFEQEIERRSREE